MPIFLLLLMNDLLRPPTPSFEAQILAFKPQSQPQGSNPSQMAPIPASWLKPQRMAQIPAS